MNDLESLLPHDTMIIRLKVDPLSLPGYIVVIMEDGGRWWENVKFGAKLKVLRKTTVWKDIHRMLKSKDIWPDNQGMTYWGNSKNDIIYDLAPIYKSGTFTLWVSVNDVGLVE